MEPRIQYAKTSDGVSIAYCAAGDAGPGRTALRGFDEAVRLDDVRWREEG